MTRTGTLRLATFDVERRWRPPGLARLPAVRDPGGDRAVAAMDELLAVTCGPGDILVTGAELPASFFALFSGAGIELTHRVAPPAAADPDPSMEQRLLREPMPDLWGLAFAPYAVLAETAQLVRTYQLRADLAPLETVSSVSSKAWSNSVVNELGLRGGGTVVDSVPGLLTAVEALGQAPILLKDPYGVGGRGILELASPRVLSTVCRVLSKQVDNGSMVQLLVQPKFDKEIDFSAQFYISIDGTVDWYGVQLVENVGFTHIGVRPVPGWLQELLTRMGYQSIMRDVGAALASAGYRGPVCVDSMLLRDGTIVPLLEINPRMSIGMITVLAARRLAPPATTARLAVRTLRCERAEEMFGTLLTLMRDEDVLFTSGRTGLLPLAVNTLRTSRGRLNCLVVARNNDEDERLGTALNLILERAAAMTDVSGNRVRVGADHTKEQECPSVS